MTKNELKQRVIDIIDAHENQIISIGDDIYREPELGYREIKTTNKVIDFLQNLSLDVEDGIAFTGCRTQLNSEKNGPCIALLGELDAVVVQGHQDATGSGCVHACGHNAQLAGLLGAVLGLTKSGVLPYLDGRIDVMATPAEEFIELEYRNELKRKGLIHFFGGKQELIYRGYFDHVDMCMMFHVLDLDENQVLLAPQSNGFIGKTIQFLGKSSHAGSAPDQGVNALNAAMLGMMNIHAQRETFRESDRVRVHPIITKGGDIVNVVPADVRMEACVRARTIDAMITTNKKVDRALAAGAMTIGADVSISDIPGYLPILNYDSLDNVFLRNLESLGIDKIVQGGDFTGSFDFGDISQIMPAIHPMIGGVKGDIHSKEFLITDKYLAYILPAKVMALTVIDLLFDNGSVAREILSTSKPPFTKSSYLTLMERLTKYSEFDGEKG